jgi:hypothetical protein
MGGMEVWLHTFLMLAFDKVERLATCYCHVTGEQSAGIHGRGSWVFPRASLGALQKRKIPCHYGILNSSSSIILPIALPLY